MTNLVPLRRQSIKDIAAECSGIARGRRLRLPPPATLALAAGRVGRLGDAGAAVGSGGERFVLGVLQHRLQAQHPLRETANKMNTGILISVTCGGLVWKVPEKT